MQLKVLGFDFETTSEKTAECRITEIGWELRTYDGPGTWKTVKSFGTLVFDPTFDYTAYDANKIITGKTGITSDMLKAHGAHSIPAMAAFWQVTREADVWMAHNGLSFDLPVFRAETARHLEGASVSRPVHEDPTGSVVFVDTMLDVPFPMKVRNMTHLAAEHGFLNPFPHRALYDVSTMFRVVEPYLFEGILVDAKTPLCLLHAQVKFDERQRAKDHGFRWHAGSKRWMRRMRQAAAERTMVEAATVPGAPPMRILPDEPAVDFYA